MIIKFQYVWSSHEKTRFLAKWITDILSQCSCTRVREPIPISCNSLTNQVTSANAEVMTLYSNSENDLKTVLYFLDFQVTNDYPNNKI